MTVDMDRCGRHHTTKVNKHSLTRYACWQLKMTPVQRDELIVLIVKPMPRQQLVRMRNRHTREPRVVKAQRRSTGRVLLAEQPFTIERINTSPLLCLS